MLCISVQADMMVQVDLEPASRSGTYHPPLDHQAAVLLDRDAGIHRRRMQSGCLQIQAELTSRTWSAAPNLPPAEHTTTVE